MAFDLFYEPLKTKDHGKHIPRIKMKNITCYTHRMNESLVSSSEKVPQSCARSGLNSRNIKVRPIFLFLNVRNTLRLIINQRNIDNLDTQTRTPRKELFINCPNPVCAMYNLSINEEEG